MALAKVGIISIGDMGVGIAKLLQAHGFEVLTTVEGRSQATRDRATSNNIDVVTTDVELCNTADYILSIVPPASAVSTVERIIAATSQPSFHRNSPHSLYLLNLNAISPATSRHIASRIPSSPSPSTQQTLVLLDGAIIGGPPTPPSTSTSTPSTPPDPTTWTRPTVVLSGPTELPSLHPAGATLAHVLSARHVGSDPTAAVSVKMCFAALSKGFTGLAVLALSTAEAHGVRGELAALMDVHVPGQRARAERGVVGCGPKAARWVAEMREIGDTMGEVGFEEGREVFEGIARVFGMVAGEREKGGRRTGGVDEAVGEVVDGLRKREERD